MKYKITVEFEVEDSPNFNIEKAIKEQGKELTEQNIMLGFNDPEYIGTTCTIQERCGDCNGSKKETNQEFCRTCRGSGYER